MKILIVDDSTFQIKNLKSLLEEYAVFETCCGLSAIELANDIIPDIIIIDSIMPGINGYDVLKILKTNDLTKNIPIIMTSEKNTDFNKYKASFFGATKLLAKPFKKKEVLEVLKLAPKAYLKHCLEKELDSSNNAKQKSIKI
jgi:PleD family two-component response regulator